MSRCIKSLDRQECLLLFTRDVVSQRVTIFDDVISVCSGGCDVSDEQLRIVRFNDGALVQLQCDQKKSPNVYKSCPEMISLEK